MQRCPSVQVYRMASDDIGCSLAEAAETGLYSDYLSQAAATGKPAMHVVYINTSLKTKAEAHAVVPTITCTSSNVVQTVLQVSPLASLCRLHPPFMTSSFTWSKLLIPHCHLD